MLEYGANYGARLDFCQIRVGKADALSLSTSFSSFTTETGATSVTNQPKTDVSVIYFLLTPFSPSQTSKLTVPFPFFPLLAQPRSPSRLPPFSRQLYYKKYTVSLECPSDIFDLLASFRTVFNQPP